MKVTSSICLLAVLLTACEDYSESYTDVNAVVGVPTISPTLSEADGESQTLIEIKFSVNVAAEKAVAELKTTAGLFKETGKDAITLSAALEKAADGTLSRIIRTQLINPVVDGDAILTSRVAGFMRTDKLAFKKAQPDSIIVELDKMSLKKGLDNTAIVTVSLLRRQGRGKSAVGLPIALILQDKDGHSHGHITPSYGLSGADGKCKFLISRGSDSYGGNLYIKAVNIQTGLLSKPIEILSID